jgi:hypothetical protein
MKANPQLILHSLISSLFLYKFAEGLELSIAQESRENKV